jgi:glycogen synthase
MPSFYEPFGSANEGFAHATPVIARAVGGLLSQVVSSHPFPVPDYCRSFFVAQPDQERKPTGILYREEYRESDIEDQWRLIYALLPEKRTDSALYLAMVEASFTALQRAISIFQNRALYEEMVVNGLRSLENFGWEAVISKYRRVYNCVVRSAL